MSLQAGQTLKDRYEIVKILGEGGMGTVYQVRDQLMLGRVRALKELYPDPLADETKLLAARAQFEREAQALEKLQHPNLPHVSDYFSIDENDYLIMDYIEGESLAQVLSRQQQPTEDQIYYWIAQILDALAYCHDHNVLHRDVKPANLILTPEGKLMLVDFSLVKLLDPHNPRTATIVRGVGTPQYTPLEQYDASMGHTDARSDIYALGATLYHVLTGQAPQPVSQRILNPDTQRALQELDLDGSPWMAKFVQKAMTIRPQDRYQSAGEMRQELETQLFKLKPPTKRPPRVSPGSGGRNGLKGMGWDLRLGSAAAFCASWSTTRTRKHNPASSMRSNAVAIGCRAPEARASWLRRASVGTSWPGCRRGVKGPPLESARKEVKILPTRSGSPLGAGTRASNVPCASARESETGRPCGVGLRSFF